MKKWKLALITAILVAFMSGLYVNANCSAQATGCSASCSVTAPPGGSTQCTGTATSATCIAYNSSGAQCKFFRCYCPPTGYCLAMIPTC